eukprot:s6960_g4.t1
MPRFATCIMPVFGVVSFAARADTVDRRREQRMSPDGPPSSHNCLGYLESDSIGTRGRGRPADVAQHRGVEKKPTAEAIEVSCRSVDAI